ncbi:MAG: hypothetical protein PHO89_11435 [Methylacidiphilaceae bacterium]|nr:hypothetical protein [Candidatus Methylacidiphilaceae bacterium]
MVDEGPVFDAGDRTIGDYGETLARLEVLLGEARFERDVARAESAALRGELSHLQAALLIHEERAKLLRRFLPFRLARPLAAFAWKLAPK